MMLLASPSSRSISDPDNQDLTTAQQTLVNDLFGEDADLTNEQPSIEKVIVLLWLFREDESVLGYLTNMMETNAMKRPIMLDELGMYIPPLIQMALQWDPLKSQGHEENISIRTNLVERSLLVMSQLSTRFAVQYHWALNSLLQELQPKRAGASIDTTKFARCLKLSGNLQRCMCGRKRPDLDGQQAMANNPVPMLEIMSTVGGKVTNDEHHAMYEEEDQDTNQNFFDTILSTANENVGRYVHVKTTEDDSSDIAAWYFEPEQELPLKHSFGGVLLFKRQDRKYGRRKTWKRRFFAIEETMLNCYSRERKLLRSISLEGATLWKGQQKKYPHSFIIANNSTLFYLQASSDEQKSLWKRKLREVIDGNKLPEDLSETQKERHNRFQGAKWFGRMLADTSYELGCVAPAGRKDFLYEDFFDLDIPRQVYWPWRSSNTNEPATDAPEKSVYVVLPHFSHLVSDFWSKRDLSPRFEASFILSTDKTLTENSGTYEKFLKEGRQGTALERPEMPESLLGALRAFSSQSLRNDVVPKDADGGSTTGESTSGMSISGSSEGSTTAPTDCEGTSKVVRNRQDGRSVGTEDGTCDSDKSSDMSSTESVVEQIEIELADDISLFGNRSTKSGMEMDDEESEEEESMDNFCVELELINEPPEMNDESKPAEDDCDVSLSESITGSVAKCSILPQTAKGLVAVRTKKYLCEELMAVQFAKYYESFFASSMVWLRPPREQRLNQNTVIVDVPKKAVSIAEAKHPRANQTRSLLEHFIAAFGPPESEEFQCAQMCFTQSLAGLSLLTYLFGIKNRHDDNLMLDDRGRIFMTDFSGVFGADPLELSPFKLPKEFIDVMGGPTSDGFQHFQDLFASGLKMARDDAATAISFGQVVAASGGGNKRCQKAIGYLRKKLMLATPEDLLDEKIASLIEHSQLDLMAAAKDAVLPKPKQMLPNRSTEV